MKYKTFGKHNEEVSLAGYGAWGIGGNMWGKTDDEESKKSLSRAIEQGVTLFDSALVYGNGHSEKLIGELERESGKTLFITSKIPSKKFEWPAKDSSTLEQSFPYEHIIKSTEKSLRNLNRDYIDLQQFHVWNDAWADNDEWKEAIRKLKQDGKIRYFGISINDHQPWNGIEAGKSGLIDAYQVIFNLFDQSPRDELFPFCKENKIAIIARVPLDEGSLAGIVDENTVYADGDFRKNYFRVERRPELIKRVNAIRDDVAGATDSIAEASLRFIISFDEVTTVIPGMRQEKNLLANVASINRGPLPIDLVERLGKHRWVRNFYD